MAVRPKLDPEFQELVERTRARLAAAGELRPPVTAPYESPFDDETRKAILELVRSGEYRRLADAIAAEDPEIADL